jgi:hypothetical protein
MLSGGAAAQQCASTWPYTLSNGNLADASQVMADFNAIRNCPALGSNPVFNSSFSTFLSYASSIDLDVNNGNTGTGANSIIRLVTQNSSETGEAPAQLVKYAFGGFYITNADTIGYTAFSNGSAEQMRITQSGVGIGTSAPAYLLDLRNSSEAGQLHLSGTGGDNGGYIMGWGTGGLFMNAGANFNGSSWIAKDGAASLVVAGGGSVLFYNNTGLTTGSSYTPTLAVSFVGSNAGFGNSAPAYLLHVGSAAASGIVAEFQNSSGACTHTPGSSSETVSCSSDARFKSDIQDTTDALVWLNDLRIRDFTWKATGERRTGVIAQEVNDKHPEMVHIDANGYYTVDEPNPWKVIRAVQQLKAENHALRAANDNAARNVASLTIALKEQQAEIGKLRAANNAYTEKLARFEASERRNEGSLDALARRLDEMQRKTGTQIARAASQ